ncbi:hypothetical protein [Enterococcus cecorum]|uniref:hypothetical protein n=1 Tax=Enterococcus cecorum TaxID=44008 RepID=UPI00148CB9FA|nr:hypothetical protein [Enterococcus cecorum]
MNEATKSIIHGIKWMNDTESEHLVSQYKKYFVEGIYIPAIVKVFRSEYDSTFTFEGEPIDLYWAIVEWYDDAIGFEG